MLEKARLRHLTRTSGLGLGAIEKLPCLLASIKSMQGLEKPKRFSQPGRMLAGE